MKRSRTGIFIQARSNSSRLPGKIYETIPGLPGEPKLALLEIIHRKMLRVEGVDEVVILIPDDDHRLLDFCGLNDLPFFQGSGEDVRDRYRRAASFFNVENVVRATGDNPCVDEKLAGDTVAGLLASDADLFSYPNLPLGVAVEAFRRSALDDDDMGNRSEYKEHVSLHIKHNPSFFRVRHPDHPVMKHWNFPVLPRLTVDTPEDLRVVRRIFARLGHDFALEDVLALYGREPGLFRDNQHVEQITFPPDPRV